MKTLKVDVVGPFPVHVLGYVEDTTNEDGNFYDKLVIERHNKSHDKFNKERHKRWWIQNEKEWTERRKKILDEI